jgi:hypothetical protein
LIIAILGAALRRQHFVDLLVRRCDSAPLGVPSHREALGVNELYVGEAEECE